MFGSKIHSNGRAMTETGQTGADAYAYEVAQIANARRELDARMANLVAVMTRELPETVVTRHSIATDRFPDAWIAGDRDSLVRQLEMNTLADPFCTDFVQDVAMALADPEYVIGR